jgi:hypothetical protein
MPILPALATQFQSVFPSSDHGRERARRFILTLQAILLPITASRTSNLLRTIATLCGVVLGEAKHYTFMASVKLPWARVRAVLGGRSPTRSPTGACWWRWTTRSSRRPAPGCLPASAASTMPPRPLKAVLRGRRPSPRSDC